MGIIQMIAAAGGLDAYLIDKSLRFNDDDTPYLNRTPLSSTTNPKQFTFSFWAKPTSTGAVRSFFGCGAGSLVTGMFQMWLESGRFIIYSVYDGEYRTDAYYRDPSAWYHFVVAVDSTLATASDRWKLWVNGVRVTDWYTETHPAQDKTWIVNTTTNHEISGIRNNAGTLNGYWDGYLAEYYIIDGQAKTAADFGQTNATTGQWVPKEYSGSYGTNGFYLKFGDLEYQPQMAKTATGKFWTQYKGTYTNDTQANAKTGSTYRIKAGDIFTGLDDADTYSSGDLLGVDKFNSQIWRFASLTSTDGAFTGGFSSGSQTISNWKINHFDSGTTGWEDNYVSCMYYDGSDGDGTDYTIAQPLIASDSSGNGNHWDANNLTQMVSTISSPNLPSWSTVDSGWAATNSNYDGTYTGSGYAHIITGALTDSTTYHFYLDRKDASAQYGGWFFTDTTSPLNTVPDELGGNSLGQRYGESNAGAYGTYATANNVTAGQGVFTGWGSIMDQVQQIEFVVNRTVDKVWMRDVGDTTWLGGGDPSNTSSTASFLLPDGDTIYFGCVDHASGGYANITDIIGILSDVDVSTDTPTPFDDEGNGTGNYCTMNPLNNGSNVTLSEGNLQTDASNSSWTINNRSVGTIGMRTGKWYWECHISNHQYNYTGMISTDNLDAAYPGVDTTSIGMQTSSGTYYGGGAQAGNGANTGSDVTLMYAFDADNKKMWFGVDGTWLTQGGSNVGNPSAGTYPSHTGFGSSNTTYFPANCTYDSVTCQYNFGARSFAHTPPTGFKALNTYNLDDPLIDNPSKHFDIGLDTGPNILTTALGLTDGADFVWIKDRDNSDDHILFNRINDSDMDGDPHLISNDTDDEDDCGAYTAPEGDGVAWVWNAGDANTSVSVGDLNSTAYDQSQTWSGNNNASTGTVITETGAYYGATYDAESLFNGDVSAMMYAETNNDWIKWEPASNYSYSSTIEVYCTSAPAAPANQSFTLTRSDNTTKTVYITSNKWTTIETGSGTLKSIKAQSRGNEWNYWSAVRIDGKMLVDSGVTTPDFPSIASTYRANPTAGFSIVTYEGNGSANQTVAHGLNATPKMIHVKKRDGTYDWISTFDVDGVIERGYLNLLDAFNSESVSYNSSTWELINSSGDNGSGDDFIAYVWSEVEGYSKFGTYVGNNSPDGPFVYCGFKPAYILLKCSNHGEYWIILDNKRDTYNEVEKGIYVHPPNAEDSSGDVDTDFLSNGFKIRADDNRINGDTNKSYIFAAFAETPFKYSNAR